MEPEFPTPPQAAQSASDQAIARLAEAYLTDRRRERRWRVFFRLAWLLLAATLVVVMSWQGLQGSSPSGPHTALIDVRGEIAMDAEASAENLISALRNAFGDSGAQAVVLRINSPGGSPVQAGMINDEIERLRRVHDKPVYAVCEEVCASAAFYIAAAADEVFVDKASLVGSIGVLMDGFGFTGLMDKLGVERRLLTAGENKGFLDPFSPQTERHKAYAQALLNQIHQQFIAEVRQGRGERLSKDDEVYSGLIWSGQQAIDLGLADRYGSLDYVAREVVKAEDIIDYTPRQNVAERLAKRFGAAVGEGIVAALRGVGTLR
jgi:protease-4